MEDLKTQADYAARYRKHIEGYIASIVRTPFKPSRKYQFKESVSLLVRTPFKPSRKYQFKESVSLLALACHGRL